MKFKRLALAAVIAAALHHFRDPLRSSRLNQRVVLANIAEDTHPSSQGVTYEADVAITERNLLVKRGGASNRVAICGAADTPIGVCSDEAAAAADLVNAGF